MKKRLLLAVLILTLPGVLGASETQSIRMKVKRMACLACAEKLKGDLTSLCREISIDIKKGELVCRFVPPTTPKKILSMAKTSGMGVSRIE